LTPTESTLLKPIAKKLSQVTKSATPYICAKFGADPSMELL